MFKRKDKKDKEIRGRKPEKVSSYDPNKIVPNRQPDPNRPKPTRPGYVSIINQIDKPTTTTTTTTTTTPPPTPSPRGKK